MGLLRAFPPLLAALFAVSFVWDHEGLLRILSVSGWIGYGTNWIAVTMLFRPQQRRPILGQGLIPAQKDRIAVKLAEAVDRNLINPDAIRDRLRQTGALSEYLRQASLKAEDWMSEPETRDTLNRFLIGQVRRIVEDTTFREEVSRQALDRLEASMADTRLERIAFSAYRRMRGKQAMHILDQAILGLPELVEAQIDRVHAWVGQLPGQLEPHVETVEDRIIEAVHQVLNRIDLKGLMVRNLQQYDEGRLERLIQDATIDQLRYIQYLGAVLGTIGGLVIWDPVRSVPLLALLAAVVWGADRLIGRRSTSHVPDRVPHT